MIAWYVEVIGKQLRVYYRPCRSETGDHERGYQAVMQPPNFGHVERQTPRGTDALDALPPNS